MKTNKNNLNKIFKAPLFRALSLMAIFFSFLLIGAVNTDEVVQADSGWDSPTVSGGSISGSSISFTSRSPYVVAKHWTTGLFDLNSSCEIKLVIGGLTYGYYKSASCETYLNTWVYLYFSNSYNPDGITYSTSSSYMDFYIPLAIVPDSGSVSVTLYGKEWYTWEKSVSFTVSRSSSITDYTYPSITWGGGYTDGKIYAAANTDIYFYITDSYTGIYSLAVAVTLKGSWTLYAPVDYGTRGYSVRLTTGSPSSDSSFAVAIEGCDYLGYCTTLTAPIYIDVTAPSYSSSTLIGTKTYAQAGYTSSSSIYVSAKCSDSSGSGVNRMVLKEGSTTLLTKYTSSFTSASATLASSTAGTHTLTLYMYDNVGNCTTRTLTIILDSTNPTITTFTVTGNSGAISGYTNTTSVTYSITASDTYFYGYQVQDGSTTINARSTTKPSSGTIGTATGSHTLTLTVWDKAGNSTTKTYSIYYDPTTNTPTISTFTVTGNSGAISGYTNTTSVTYSITASDTLSGVYYYQVTDGSTTVYSKSTTKPTSDTLGSTTTGNHTLTLTVWDKAGNSATKTYTIYYDPNSPSVSTFTVTGNSCAVSGYTNTTSVSYSISASDALSGVYYYQVKDGSTTVYSKSSTKPTTDTLGSTTNGSHSLTLTVWDKAGNSATKTYSIVYDNVAPSFSSFNITGNSGALSGYTNTTSVSYATTMSDDTSGVYWYQVKDGSTTIGSKGTTKHTSGTIGTATGTHTLTYTIWDKACNSVEVTDTIYYDPNAPTIDSFSATGNSDALSGYTNTTSVSLNMGTSDALSGVYYYQVKDGSSVIYSKSSTKPTSVTLANTTTGNHTLTLTIWDKAGNSDSTPTYTIYYDPNAPTIDSFSATGNSDALAGYTNTTSISLSIGASDALSGVYWYQVKDGSSVIYSKSTTKPTSVTLANSTNGNHVLTLTIWDKAGNSDSSPTYTIHLDTVAPSFNSGFKVVGNTCAVSGYTNQRAVTYSGIDAIDVNPYKYKVTDGSTVINALSTTAPTGGTLASATNGTHAIKVYMVDKAGNSGYASFDIVLDTVAPTFTGFNVVGSAGTQGGYTPSAGYTATRSVTYELTGIGDATSGVYWYRVLDGETNMNAKGTTKVTSGTLPSSTNGTHTIKYTIWDKACNSREITDTIILDTVRPVVNVTTNNTTKTTVINFSDTYLKTNAKIGSNYSYYMSESSSVDLSLVTKIKANGTVENGSDVPMYVSGQSYYLYIMTNEITRDHAGNVPAPSSPISIYGTGMGGYSGYTYRVAMNVNTSDYGDSSVPIDPDKLASDSQSKATEYKVDVMLKDRTLMITIQREKFSGAVSITLEKLNEVLATAGYKILGIGNATSYSFTKSAIYHDVLISKTDHTQNEIIDLIFVVEAPSKS